VKTYRVKEIFDTIQGEGYHAGSPACFIRLVGCNMWSGYEEDRLRDAERNRAHCPLWCDTDFTKEGSEDMSALRIAQIARNRSRAKIAVITGGEPLLQLSPELVIDLREHGFAVHVETNGTQPWQWRHNRPDWICVSPKTDVNRLQLFDPDEIKLVMPDYHPSSFMGYIGNSGAKVFIQPEDGPRYKEALRQSIQIVREYPIFRLSIQIHKLVNLP
jgi:organic radical activating enzyme